MLKQLFVQSRIAGLVGACLLAGLPSLSCAASATTVGGWNVNGLVEGVDTVEAPKADAGGDSLLVVDKKSPYQAGQFLQFFKSFDARAWRGKRVHVAYEVETTLSSDTQPVDNVQAQLGTRIQCGKLSSATTLRRISNGKARSLDASVVLDVPKDASVCGFGFYILKPARVELKSMKFSEAPNAPPAPNFTMEGKQLFPFPTPGTPLPELEVGKPPVP